MNFDFSWFLTIPGMLITGGVLLLIVALIILIVSGKKGKKNPQDEQEVNVNSMVNNNVAPVQPVPVDNGIPVQEVPQVPVTPNMDVTPIQEVSQVPVMPNMDVTPVQEVSQVPVMPNMDVTPVQEVPQVPVTPNMDVTPVQEVPQVPVMPNMNVTPIQEVPQAPVMPNMNVTPIQEVPQTPIVEVATDVMPNVVPIEQPSVPIYGGVSPAVPKINLEPEHHEIYGGANPLENTQSIPTVNNPLPVQPEVVAQPTIINPQVEQTVPQIQEVPMINPVSTDIPIIQPTVDSTGNNI